MGFRKKMLFRLLKYVRVDIRTWQRSSVTLSDTIVEKDGCSRDGTIRGKKMYGVYGNICVPLHWAWSHIGAWNVRSILFHPFRRGWFRAVVIKQGSVRTEHFAYGKLSFFSIYLSPFLDCVIHELGSLSTGALLTNYQGGRGMVGSCCIGRVEKIGRTVWSGLRKHLKPVILAGVEKRSWPHV